MRAIEQISGKHTCLLDEQQAPNNNKKKEHNMKTVNKTILCTAMAAGLAMAAWLPNTANAAEQMKPMKGGEHLLMLQGINTKQEADALKADDSIAMVCAKCKTVWVARVKQGTKGA